MPVLGEIIKEGLLEGHKNHRRRLIWDACPNCGHERWVRKELLGHLCIDCARRDESKNEKVSRTLTGRKRDWSPSPEHREKQRQAILGKKCTPEHIEKVRQSSLRQWRDPVKREQIVKSLLEIRSPNKQELEVLALLNENFGNEWVFVGNGDLIVGGFCPDFLNVNHEKILVEYFGRYWHRPQDGKFKAKVYAKFGYKTLIIWSEEMREKDKLIERISNWLNEVVS